MKNNYLIIIILCLIYSCTNKINRYPSSKNITCDDAFTYVFNSIGNKQRIKARNIAGLKGYVGGVAEIGGGIGIARNFLGLENSNFTHANSFYGMEASNRKYGKQRFITEQRLDEMVGTAFKEAKATDNSKLGYALGSTVTTNKDGFGHGWIGVKFEDRFGNIQTVKVHVEFEKTSVLNQHDDISNIALNLLNSLMNDAGSKDIAKNITTDIDVSRIKLDKIVFEGDKFKGNKDSAYKALLDSGIADFLLIDKDNTLATGRDIYYGKDIKLQGNAQEGELVLNPLTSDRYFSSSTRLQLNQDEFYLVHNNLSQQKIKKIASQFDSAPPMLPTRRFSKDLTEAQKLARRVNNRGGLSKGVFIESFGHIQDTFFRAKNAASTVVKTEVALSNKILRKRYSGAKYSFERINSLIEKEFNYITQFIEFFKKKTRKFSYGDEFYKDGSGYTGYFGIKIELKDGTTQKHIFRANQASEQEIKYFSSALIYELSKGERINTMDILSSNYQFSNINITEVIIP